MKRIFLIVLDSCGIGGAKDAAAFGDEGSDTLAACVGTGLLHIPHLISLGLGNIAGVSCLPKADRPRAAFARLRELSPGKDTTIGHWEIAGIVSPKPLPTYPDGFPPEVINAFKRAVGRGVLCNKPISGTEVIRRYGDEHLRTGDLIVYTSADSVFQVAAHEDLIPVEELYEICRKARAILTGEHAVGRVIARPFITGKNGYERTSRRHDFSLAPPERTLLDAAKDAGLDVLSVGKIEDIFAGRGVTEGCRTRGNTEGIEATLARMDRVFHGLCFTNLVDFDMLYGHRNDAPGYARALNEFDAALPRMLAKLGPEDALMITADHGCDPSTPSTDHSREDVPFLLYGERIRPGDLGEWTGFHHIAATIAVLLGLNDRFGAEPLVMEA
ncbi:MAG: phosphopentomutase [Clostridia bacterium]|nr:phosphopentomutase [Clostridia bacterium]